MVTTAFYDTETDGLLRKVPGKTQATKLHCLGFQIGDQWWACWDDLAVPMPASGFTDMTLPSGVTLSNVRCASIREGLEELAKADIRVAHNGQDFDERIVRKFYPWWDPNGRCLDTLLISRLLYTNGIAKQGPNTHKCPPILKTRHSLEAWGYRLGEKKDKDFDPGDWQTFSWDMLIYCLQDIVVLVKLFKYLMSQKPSMEAVEIEHDFAAIIRRQEVWGATIAYEKMLTLAGSLTDKKEALEAELKTQYGSFWAAGKRRTEVSTRNVKMTAFPDVTMPRTSPTTGKPLKPYVGPPLCLYEKGATWTPIEWTEFNPGSRDHVFKMLTERRGWKPFKKTTKGDWALDDAVLRALPYPEAEKLADYYEVIKILGYVAKGAKAWMTKAEEERDPDGKTAWRMHGRVTTIGAGSHRASHEDPNTGNVPTRGQYGHACRELFEARRMFQMVGFDGSGMQLRLLAHYLAKGGKLPNGRVWGDGGAYSGPFIRGEDQHEFMRDSIGVDLMGEGQEGRSRGKILNYALPFGAGLAKMGSIIDHTATEKRRKELGQLVKERMMPVFGTAFDDLKLALSATVENKGHLVGLDGRTCVPNTPNSNLAFLLQMGEAVVMRKALILCDNMLKSRGLVPGVDPTGEAHPELADYEFCLNVHDEAQADVKAHAIELYRKVAAWCVTAAGKHFKLLCPLTSDVKVGPDWTFTH